MLRGVFGDAGGHKLPLRLFLETTKGDDNSETLLRLGSESLNDMMQWSSMVSDVWDPLGLQMAGRGRGLGGEGGSMRWWKPRWLGGGANTAFSITSAMFRVRHDPNEDRNMREIRIFSRFSMAHTE